MQKNNLAANKTFMLSNGRSAFSESLGEFALAAMLHFNKQIPRLMVNKLEKRWDKFTMNTITGAKVGFVGFGEIGKTTAKMLQTSFNVEIQVLKRTKCEVNSFENLKIERVYGFKDENKDDIYSWADYIICSLPGTSETTKFIGKAQFKKMKTSAVFVSLGRGVVVDEEALLQALTENSIYGAALDVFHEEPLPSSSLLWTAPNLLVSPHNADYTKDYFQLGLDVFYSNLEAYLNGKPLITPAKKHLGY